MAKTVNVGFIGCGGNARGHMNNFMNTKGAKVVAVCDVVEDRVKQAGEQTGAEAYTDMNKMLERDDLSAVCISIPVHAHGAPELATIKRGLPFLVEKPVARDLGTAKKVLAAVKRKKLITCVGYQLRYAGGTVAAKKLLKGQTIALVVGQYWSGTGRGDPKAWIRQYQKSGGQILEQATHAIDMMRYLCGDVASVYTCRARRELKEIDCPDVHSVSMAFKSGAVGALTATWAYDPRDWSHANIVSVTYADKLLRWLGGAKAIVSGGGADPEEHVRAGKTIEEAFVKAVRTGNDSGILSPYSDAVKSLEVSLAINQSGETGKVVKLGR